MVSQKVVVINEQGIHMRPAGVLAKAVKAHADSEVTLTVNGKTVKAKAPMAIMSACIKKGNEVEITVEGGTEAEVLAEIVKMFEEGFGE